MIEDEVSKFYNAIMKIVSTRPIETTYDVRASFTEIRREVFDSISGVDHCVQHSIIRSYFE